MHARFEFFTADPVNSVKFYVDVLGFKQIQLGNNPNMVQQGDVIIGFGYIDHLEDTHYFRPEISTERLGLGIEIVLEVDNITDIYKSVTESAYPIYEDLKLEEWGLTDFRIIDPDGYYLRITSKDYPNPQ